VQVDNCGLNVNCGSCGINASCSAGGTCVCDNGWADCQNGSNCDCQVYDEPGTNYCQEICNINGCSVGNACYVTVHHGCAEGVCSTWTSEVCTPCEGNYICAGEGECVWIGGYNCPFFYSWNSEFYTNETTFLYNIDNRRKKTTTLDTVKMLDISGLPKAKIVEFEAEQSFIDYLSLKVTMKNNQVITLRPVWASRDADKLMFIDYQAMITNQGDEVYVVFEPLAEKYLDTVEKIEVEANGYYEIYPGHEPGREERIVTE